MFASGLQGLRVAEGFVSVDRQRLQRDVLGVGQGQVEKPQLLMAVSAFPPAVERDLTGWFWTGLIERISQD
ncbi:hypothetical protein ASG32_24935 [Methylobacterium sp. Leaf361]|nr:hypothetical protein ASG32_24935 [Methylobacterium sp. Leaf361]